MTIRKLIQDLNLISENKKDLPLVIQAPNGELVHPTIKMMWDEPLMMFEKEPDKMIITYKD